jgi:tetratricopeptide (TPR) repeat protein
MEVRLLKFFKLFLICALISLLIICISLFWPRFRYQEGITQLKLKNYKEAVGYFDMAEQAMPDSISSWFARADLFRVYSSQGKALYHLGVKTWHEDGLAMPTFDLMVRAKSYLAKANEIESAHFINSYWLARTEETLEKTFPWLHPETQNPYNAEPYYQKALPLRPSGMIIRYAYIKYINDKGLNEKIPGLVRTLMRIHPRSYYPLKKESFFTDELIPHIEQGLNLALENQTLPRDAFKALSDIQLSRNDLQQAISYYNQFLEQKPNLNSFRDYIHMGRLYLKDSPHEISYEYFKKGLIAANHSEKSINWIYRVFKQENRHKDFLNFSGHLEEIGLGSQLLDIFAAKCWMDMGQPQFAKARLIQINARQPHAPAYYLLAKIAQKGKDWDQMEIAIQKATRLDPDNSGYYYLFSQALKYQKKYAHAEEIATKAIQHSPKENYGYFNNRAQIRWRLKKYIEAADDWEKAFSLKPDHSDFPYHIAMAYEREGQINEGLVFIKQAIALDTNKSKYKTVETRLKANHEKN